MEDQMAGRMPDIDWDDYFMATAFLSAKRSKDPNTQVGACIVNNDNRIVGTGYNGMPNGCEFPWNRVPRTYIQSKHLYECHAEMNAIMNKYSSDLRNCTMYTSIFPCNECAKIIIQSGIKEVIYVNDQYPESVEIIAAKRMFDAATVIYRPLTPRNPRNPIIIDF
ncbi:deoxycytidylate deaminase isoform X4 [Solenopsis invicta]|uniref:deoxycytidylate deaminase isoform X3 n=1 Tax=Solenopsis invicta TaxID=13686 RepID=UPI00193CB343|nr:deoxycytidylate deaminase isoform X3 [Solenopsis invicta]XP_039302062.1 deoxycytidylate deaminase isoform X4 [Solenopsis invicta]